MSTHIQLLLHILLTHRLYSDLINLKLFSDEGQDHLISLKCHSLISAYLFLPLICIVLL